MLIVGIVVHAFHASIQEAEAGRSQLEASLVYKVNSRIVGAVTQRIPVLKN